MLEEKDKRIVRALADGIPLVPQPYAELSKKAGVTEEEFLARLRKLKATGVLRRVGAVLQHRKAGFVANALCVWQIPRERVDEIGNAVKCEPFVSHCYLRETTSEWPYNFYVMLHGKDRKQCEELAKRIEAENHIGDCRMYYSVREWKKTAMRYFCESSEEKSETN